MDTQEAGCCHLAPEPSLGRTGSRGFMSGRVSVIPLCVHAANGPGAASSLPVFATNTVLSSLVPPFHLGGWLPGIDLSGKIGSTRPGLLEVTAQVHLKPFVERGKQSSLTSPSMTKFLLKRGPHRVTICPSAELEPAFGTSPRWSSPASPLCSRPYGRGPEHLLTGPPRTAAPFLF